MANMIKKTKLLKKNKHLHGSSSVDVRLPDDSSTAMVENWEGAADTDETTQGPRLLKKSVRKSDVKVPSPVLSTEEYSSDSDADEGLSVNSRAKQRERRKAEKDRLRRTVFVGNLPAWMTRRALRKLFSGVLKKSKIDTVDCTIESVRLRGAVPITGGTSKQAKKRSSIRREFAAGDKHTQIGFVVLTSTVGISTVLKLNGYLLTKDDADSGRHIRVDICSRRNPSYNKHKSVFIGNLPFSANEEEVRQVFQPFGNITNVRLVRDSATGAVKGIGFVEFEDPSSVALVIRQAALDHSGGGGDSTESQSLVVGGRRLRIEAWKSIKKSKKTKQQRRTKLGSHQEQRSVGAGSVNFRVPTNLRGAAARKEFVKRTLQKRNKRKRTNAMASTAAAGKAPKTRKFGSVGGRNAKRKKSYSRK